jgi:hypothetical protein
MHPFIVRIMVKERLKGIETEIRRDKWIQESKQSWRKQHSGLITLTLRLLYSMLRMFR